MKKELFDLEEFFDEKYKYINNEGIGAVGIITQNQMVCRLTEERRDEDSNTMVRGLGPHGEEEMLICKEIFDLPSIYYDDLTEQDNKLLDELIYIRFINYKSGNYIAICPPFYSPITSKQIEALQYLSDKVEEVSPRLSSPIIFHSGDRNKTIEETNTMRNTILPFFKSKVDDSFIQTIPDKNIIVNELSEVKKI